MSNKNVVNEFFSPDLLGRMHNIDIVSEFKLCVNQKVLQSLRSIAKKRRIQNVKVSSTAFTYLNLRLIANFVFFASYLYQNCNGQECVVYTTQVLHPHWIRILCKELDIIPVIFIARSLYFKML